MTRPASPLTLALAGLLATALAGCGGGGSGDSGSGGGASGSASVSSAGEDRTASGAVPSGYPSAAAGLDLTAPGTALSLEQSATVAWQPTQQLVGALQITVTAEHSTTFARSFKGWQLDDATKANAPYFVQATVRNAGTTDLSGQAVPLYGSAASGALVEASSFASDFKPCSPGVLPTPFGPGASADVCLVYLVPDGGTLQGVTFRPTEDFDPITWTGAITPLPTRTPQASAGAKPKTGKGKGKDRGAATAGPTPSTAASPSTMASTGAGAKASASPAA